MQELAPSRGATTGAHGCNKMICEKQHKGYDRQVLEAFWKRRKRISQWISEMRWIRTVAMDPKAVMDELG